MTRSDTRGILYTAPPAPENTQATSNAVVDGPEHTEKQLSVENSKTSQATPADD